MNNLCSQRSQLLVFLFFTAVKQPGYVGHLPAASQHRLKGNNTQKKVCFDNRTATETQKRSLKCCNYSLVELGSSLLFFSLKMSNFEHFLLLTAFLVYFLTQIWSTKILGQIIRNYLKVKHSNIYANNSS